MALAIDPDVSALLERLRKDRNAGLKDLVNDALRRGRAKITAPTKPREPFRARSVDLGWPRLANVDNIAEALANAEASAHNDRDQGCPWTLKSGLARLWKRSDRP
jgi:hypothetical protein